MNGTMIEDQVYICFDGPDGLVIQTSMAAYKNYYSLLGWEFLGMAEMLPGFNQRQGVPASVSRKTADGME